MKKITDENDTKLVLVYFTRPINIFSKKASGLQKMKKVIFKRMKENNINVIGKQKGYKTCKILAHPFVVAYLNKSRGLFKTLIKEWSKKHKMKLLVEENSSLALLEYKLMDNENNEIELQ